MNYAWVEDGVVTNIIWLHPSNASEFKNAVPTNDIPVAIGDTWDGVNFLRNGERVKTMMEMIDEEMKDMEDALKLLGIESGVEI